MATDEAAAYVKEQAEKLVPFVGTNEYNEAARAIRDSVALHLGVQATQNAEQVESRFVGILQGVLRLGAAALV